MKELRDIINCCNSLPADERAALATVVRTSGSTYRKRGARMLICESGRTVGAVSGGCLERDLCERATRVMSSDSPVVVSYDDGADDPLFRFGPGCGGAVEVLIEPAFRERDNAVLEFLSEAMRLREAVATAAIITAEFGSAAPVGARLGMRAGHLHTLERADELGDDIRGWLGDEARQVLAERRSRLAGRRFLTGLVEAFVEFAPPPVSLAVFGAGVDAIPLTEFARQLGWNTVVIDHRPAYADPGRMPAADAVFCARPDEIRDLIPSVDAAVVMTHNYLADLGLLKVLLPLPLRYLAILGPRARTDSLLRDAREHGFTKSPAAPNHLHGPAGLDIGAESPAEIALAIIAEIKAALAGTSGGRLRERAGSIHDREQEGIAQQVLPARDIMLQSEREPALAVV